MRVYLILWFNCLQLAQAQVLIEIHNFMYLVGFQVLLSRCHQGWSAENVAGDQERSKTS